MRIPSIAHCVLCLVSCLTSICAAQDESSGPAVDERVSATFDTPDIDLDQLKLRLKPLTKEEVTEELDGWLDLLRQRQIEISVLDIDLRRSRAAGEAVADFETRLTDLRRDKRAVVERVLIVLESVKRKGGETEEPRRYVDAVSNLAEDVSDIESVKALALDWLKAKDGGIRLGLNLLKFLGILLVFRIVSKLLGNLTAGAMRRMDRPSELLKQFAAKSVRKTVMLIGIVMGVAQLGIDIGPLVAAIGAAGLVIGFALQGTLSNFASGLMILFYKPFDVGDVVTFGSSTGKVKALSLVNTTITTADNQTIIMPNNSVWSGTITNSTGNDLRRVDLVFGIGYDDDIPAAEKLLREIAEAHPLVLADPPLNLRVGELAESSVNLLVRPWTKTADYWDVKWDLTREVKLRFDEAGISIPFPQRDVHLHEESKSA